VVAVEERHQDLAHAFRKAADRTGVNDRYPTIQDIAWWGSLLLCEHGGVTTAEPALVDLISSWEADEGVIGQAHLDWADAVLDRQGVARNPAGPEV